MTPATENNHLAKKVVWIEWKKRREIHSTGSLTWTSLDGGVKARKLFFQAGFELVTSSSRLKRCKQTVLLNGGIGGKGTFLEKRRGFWDYIAVFVAGW